MGMFAFVIRTVGTACIALGLTAVGGCGDDPAATAGVSSGPTTQALTLPDSDAGRLAGIALDAWALGRTATAYRLDGCSRTDAATTHCTASLQFADNPSNPRSCSLAITVVATNPTVGIKEPTPAAPSIDLEIEQYELSNGGYGTYHYGDETECDQAQYASGF